MTTWPALTLRYKMASPEEIWLVDFGEPYPAEPSHHRPAIIVGPARIFGEKLPFVVVVPLTSTYRGLSLHVEIEPTEANGLEVASYAQCELIRSISRKRLRTTLGSIDLAVANEIATVIKRLLDY
jgi:mRNA interferase MazF